MKKILIALTVFVLTAGSAYAQIVVEPAATGSVATFSIVDFSSADVNVDAITGASANTYYFFAGRASYWFPYYYGNWQAVMEFDLEGLPTVGMSSNNWTARLNSLSDTGGGYYSPSSTMYVDLFDLDDNSEDGVISMLDFNNQIGTSIAQRRHISGSGYGGMTADAVVDDPNDGLANFNNIDVTEQLKRDLFGDGSGDATTGFVLIASPADANQYVFYEGATPNLTITVAPSDYNSDLDGSDNDCFIKTVSKLQ